MTTDKKDGTSNGGFTASLRNIIMIIALASSLAVGIAAIKTRASNADVAAVETRVTVTEERGKYLKERLDKIDNKLDKLLERK